MSVKPESKKSKSKNESKLRSDEKQWYVLHVYSGAENYVMKQLEDTIKRHPEVREKFGEILVPTEEVVEMRRGEKRKSERKFFPGYLLVKMIMDEETWHLIRKIPKVLRFIGGTSDRPAPIQEQEAQAILDRMEAGVSKPKPKILYEPGEVVRVIDGPFADFNGVVEDVNYEKNRLRVSVLIFGRSTPVELEFGQVEKA